jgi:uncharacterized protein (TIGR02058 family)
LAQICKCHSLKDAAGLKSPLNLALSFHPHLSEAACKDQQEQDMAKTRVLVEFGMGTSLRREDYTEAAKRAIKDALWHNSVSVAELFDFPKDAMIIDAEVGVAQPDQVDIAALKAIFPYGQPNIKVTQGGLDVEKPHAAGRTVIANAAVIVSFDMERA